jgi:hypothetical protein
MAVFDNFPEKGGAMGERRGRKVLKKRHCSSAFFPKMPLLGRVGFAWSHGAIVRLP